MTPASAGVTLPKFFADGMVLQRDQPAAVWGTASPDSKLTLSFDGKTTDVAADAAGTWSAQLPKTPADATPRDLTITGDGEPVVVHNVVVGDVWLCAGQSNMGYALSKATGGGEAIAASADPLLREFDVAVDGAPSPQTDVRGTWKSASPETAGNFSAVAYFFARELRQEVRVPIGVVHASLGGTPIEAWSRRASLDGVGFMKPLLKKSDAKLAAATQPASDLVRKSTPGWLYNGAVAPLVGLGVRGMVWYQGESNVDNAEQYRTLFPRLIQDWRKQWGMEKSPAAFLFVQIAARDEPRDEPYGSPTADLRLAQTTALDQPRTGMAVAIDTRAADWHPADKSPVGQRLARLALKIAYGRDKTETGGPIWVARRFAGGVATITFHSVGGLHAPDDGPHGFTLAGDDRRFVPAEATITGKGRDTVELRADGVERPVAVRYGWSRGPTCDLTNAAGLPAAPFRTDDWPSPTTKPK